MSSKKTKIVYLIGQLGLGGSERQLSLLLQHFDVGRYACSVVVFNPSPYYELTDVLKAAGIHVFTIPGYIKGILGRIRFLYTLFRQLSPDIVHSWTVHDNPYAGLVGWLARVPVRWGSVRGSIYEKGFQGLPWLFRWLSLHATSKLMVNARSIKTELIKIDIPPDKIIVLPNCTTLAAITAGLHANMLEQEKRVGMVGNLRSVKNHAMFIDAMAKVTSACSDVEVVIIGQPIPAEPELSRQLQKQIDSYSTNGQFRLLGHRQDVPALMRSFSVFCLTSRSEGTPNVILEAMAAARPVVATCVGGIPDLVQDGVTGFLVEPDDVDGFAKAVKTLLENPTLAEKMGEAGRRKVEQNYTCSLAVSRLTDAYNFALQRAHQL